MDRLIGYYVRAQVALHNQKGQGMVEYGLILALVAGVAIAAYSGMGTKLSTMLTNIAGKLIYTGT